MSLIKTLLKAVAIIYACVIALLFLVQKHLVFAPKKLSQGHSFNFSSDFTDGFFTSSANKQINYLAFKQPDPKQTIIYFRGNAHALDQWGFTAETLSQKTNSNVWIFDFPGFGKSDKTLPASSQELLQLGLDFYDFVIKESGAKNVVLFGRSLGSGLASHVATTHNIKNIILEAAYYSTVRVALERYPFIPSALFKYNLDNSVLEMMPDKNLLMLHGTNDTVIPYHHAKKLAEKLNAKNFITFKDGVHGNLDSYPEYWPSIKRFMKSLKL